MKTMKWIRNLLMLFWFGFSALAGITLTGLFALLTPVTLSLGQVLLIGGSIGVLIGGVVAAFLLYVLWQKFGKALLGSYVSIKMVRDAIFTYNTRLRR